MLDTYSRNPASFGLDHYVLSNPAGLTATFKGLDANVQWRSEHTVLAFGATAGHAEATNAVRGFRVDENDPGVLDLAGNPNSLVNARGRPFYDRGYTGKIALAFRLPHDVGVGALLRYQDGQPFSRLADATGLAQGPEPVRAYTPGRTRFSFVGTVDLRVQKEFAPSRGRLGLFLDVFNLFDTAREVEEIAASSPNFRDVSAVEPPRSVRIGVRVRF
jgi:outer membrane receptor protein involved in Fe transport